MATRKDRLQLIESIQQKRQTRVIAYLTGDRQGAGAQIGQDAMRPMYDHLRALGFAKVPQIDLFLYSPGGDVDVPWRMVTMLRESCECLNVLVPYKAQSAATLLALGADSIVMGKKGELGPIDPTMNRTRQRSGESPVQESVRIEDVMAYIAFLKQRAGLGDQAALASAVQILADRLDPWVLGSIYRTHSHIRTVARSLLTVQRKPIEERQISLIVETLAEKIYSHGHAIGREEAIHIGLPVEKADEELEEWMWGLFENYEEAMKLRQPIDPTGMIPDGQDSYEESVALACIESEKRLDVFRGKLKLRHIRAVPPQVAVNLNLNLQLPPNLPPQLLPPEMQQLLQQLLNQVLQQAQSQMPGLVQAELQRQAPVQNTTMQLVGASWQNESEKLT
jgi:hypothetical protein